MKLAEVTVLLASLATLCCAAALFVFAPDTARFIPVMLIISSMASAVAGFGSAVRRRSLERGAVVAARIDLPLAAAVVAAVPRKTETGVLAALNALHAMQGRCLSAGDPSGEMGPVLAEFDRAIEALQFQDETRQMLEGAADILADAGRRLEDRAGRDRPPISETKLNERLERTRKGLVARAKTKSEKDALLEVRV